ncbi:MAG: hypothetical protein Q8Q39_00415 [bacterium]|nr:hypothetical protein [bacterium]
MQSYLLLERLVRGFSNHRRIEILARLEKVPNQSLQDIAEFSGIDFRTAGEHMRRLQLASLVTKRFKGRHVLHALSPLGKHVLTFLRTLE